MNERQKIARARNDSIVNSAAVTDVAFQSMHRKEY